MGKLYYCFILVLLLCSVRISAQTYSWAVKNGTANPAGSSGNEESIRDIAVDASGNVYVIGIQEASTSADIYIAKYSSTGTVVWSQVLGKTLTDEGLSIAVSSAGDVYAGGVYTGNNVYFFSPAAVGENLYANGSSQDMFVVKYSATGAFTWARTIGGDQTDQLWGLALDANDSIVVVGSIDTDGTAITVNSTTSARPLIGSFTPGPAANGFDAVLLKLGSDGGFNGSAYWFGSTSADKVRSMTLDASGNIYLAGEFGGTVDFDVKSGVSNLTESSPQGSGDAYIAKYTSGMSLVWAGSIKGAGIELVNGLGLDGSGNLYAVGAFPSFENFDLFAGTQTLTPVGTTDAFIAKYSASTGVYSSVYKIGGTGVNAANGINVTSAGDYYVSGEYSGTANFNPNGTAVNATAVGSTDAFLSKYNSSGINSWLINTGSSGVDGGYATNIASDGKVIWGGFFTGTPDFDPSASTHSLTSTGNEDMFIAAYTECVAAAITTQPTASQTICTGSNATFTVVASGTGLTYQWKKGGTALTNGGTISGATSATLTITGLVSGDAATYTVDVIGCTGTVTSGNAVLIVPSGASITTQPVATQTVCAGTSTSFSVTATGSSLTYQWQKGGVDISGATATTYTIASPVVGDAGNYTVNVTATGCGSPLTSSVSALTVNAAPAITTQPVATQTLCAGASATMTVVASGAGLTYQWKKAGVALSNGGTISGALTASLNISSVVAGDAANYTVVVTGTCGSPVTSSVSALVVSSGASITTQPTASQSLCVGTAASFSVTASGAGLTYQWQKGGTDISGATSTSYSIASLVAGDAANYTVVVSSTCGAPVTSSISALTVNPATAISTQPVTTQTVCTGTAASMSVTATGVGLTYQWKKAGVALSNGGTISGALTATLNISSVVAGDAANYTVVVTGTCGAAVTSGTSALVVNTTTSITTQPTASQTVCTGNAVSFSVTAAGSSLTYQWQKGGSNISGATSSTYSIASVVTGDAANYTVVVTGACGAPITSSIAALTVNSSAAITTQPIVNQTLCVGDLAVFSISATGTSLTYQWQKGGVNVTNGGGTLGATSATLSISSVVAANAGNYTCNVTASGCGSPVTSNISVLAVNTPASITTQPLTQTVCTGQSLTLSVVAAGSSLTYQWQKGGVDISGANLASYSIPSLVSGDAGNYTVNVSAACGSVVTSSTAVVTVNTGAVITTQPLATQTLCAGSAGSISVTATGSGLTYQWQKGGVNISNGGTVSGALTANLNISSLVAGDAGNYTVNISAPGCGSPLTSSTSALTINNPAAITTQPVAAQTLCTGNAASFSVTATGTSPTYQWQKGGVDISGATASTYSIASLVSGDAGNYTVNVTASCGAVATSSTSVLTVNSAASITTQPTATQTVCVGSAASFSVTATGSGLTYQWQKGGANISGATASTYSIASAVAGDAGNYTVNVTASGCGTPVISSTSVLTVNIPAAITTQPVATQTLCTSNAASFSVTATGTSPTYQWQKGGVDISGATSSTYSIASLVSGDAGNYTVNVTASCGAVATSSTSVLTVNSAASITTQPTATQTLCAGAPVVFSVTATGTGLTYQWQKGGVNISGATTSSFAIASTTASDAGNYTVNVTASGCGTPVTSTTSVLTVNVPAAITLQPTATQTLCTGNTASISVIATGTALTYQWQKGGVDISGATSSTYSIASLVSGDAGNYTVNVTAACGATVTSTTSVLNVNTGASITTQPVATQTVCTSTAASFSVTAAGTSLTYQWQVGGVDISGATSSTYSIASAVAGDAGNYTVNITAPGCGAPITSTTSVLTVNVAASITTQPVGAQTLCTGNSASFSVTAAGTSLTYQWQVGGVDITGATSSTYTIASLASADAGNYTVNVTAACGAIVTSSTSVLTVNTGATITSQPVATQTVCVGTATSFSVTATGTSLTYQWQVGGVDISGATASTYSIASTIAGDAGNYSVNITAPGCGAAISSTTSVLTVNVPASITTQPVASQTFCTGNSASFSVIAAGTSLTYQWQVGGVDITGATSSTYTIASLASADAGNYTINVTAACGAVVTSSTSVLTVNTGATITTQPVATQTICVGTSASFSVTATGTSLTYQWQIGGVDISGATASTYSIASAVAGDAGNYTVNITAPGCGLITSSTSALTVNVPASITTQPVASQTFCTGNSASFNVTAAGTSLAYQWQVGGVDITGATSSTYTIASLASTDAGNYTVNVTAACGAMVTSSTSAMTVNTGASITTQPAATQTVCAGISASFSVTATGSSLTYQWQKGGVDISGAIATTYNIASTVAGDAGNYTVNITAPGCGLITSTTSALIINTTASITSQPTASQTVCAGSAAAFSVTTTGTGVTYQWQKGGVNVVDGGTISGALTNALAISSTVSTDAGNYTLIVTGTCGAPITSSVSVLNVTSGITITAQPSDVNACLGSSANFDLTASGVGLTYQWQKGGVNTVDGSLISGSTTSSLVFSSVAASDASTYTCIISSSSCGTPVTSNAVTMTVGTGATITKQPISSFICLGQQASFVVNATGATGYQWQYKPAGGSYADLPNSANVSGATTTTLVINNTQFTDRGNYRCVVSGGSCAGGVSSAAASLSFQSPSIVSQPLSQSVCNGQLVTFGVVALGNNLTYQWFKSDSSGTITVHNNYKTSGANTATLKISNVDGTDVATYYCEVQGLCPPPAYSDNVDLTITYCTAVNDPLEEETLFNIYPNPNTGISNLDLNLYAAGTLTYEIFNSLGESISSANVEGEGNVVSVIDLSTQPAGVYIIKIDYNGKRSLQRLVVDK